MSHSVILAARRSAIVPRNGAFSPLAIEEVAAPVLRAAMSDAFLKPGDVDELILANSLGAGGNPARIVALAAELPERVAGLSIDRQCVGGLDALLIADSMIRSGQCDVVIAGGAESYSRMPLRYRTFADRRPPQRYDQAQFTPWPDRDPGMAEAADRLANEFGISRGEQNAWAIDSHSKAMHAQTEQIVEIVNVSKDQFTRNLTERHCSRAKVVSGSITAANMSVAADGAAFVVVSSSEWAANRGLTGVELLGGCTEGGDPELPGLAPINAINRALSAYSLDPRDLGNVEIMEAFSVQAIACVKGAQINPAVVNRWGGSLARGHPIGASGAVLAVQLFHQLRGTDELGLAAIAAAGGLGTAVLFRSQTHASNQPC
ncbi:MAG: thiolase family protein [Sulfitobacter sp.]